MEESRALGLDAALFPLTPALSPRRGNTAPNRSRVLFHGGKCHSLSPGERAGVRGNDAPDHSHALALPNAPFPLTLTLSPRRGNTDSRP